MNKLQAAEQLRRALQMLAATLTDEQADSAVKKALKELAKLGAELRA